MDINHVNFYCRGKLGILSGEKRDANSYLFRQITEYQESDFLEHIKKHMTEYTVNNKYIFFIYFLLDISSISYFYKLFFMKLLPFFNILFLYK